MSEVPSPQAELRAEMVEIIQGAYAFGGTASRAGVAADLLLPLFAARVAAIERDVEGKERYWIERAQEWVDRAVKAEAERTVYLARSVALEHELAEVTANLDGAGDELQAAWRATGEISQRVAAERAQAAAQAWDEGWTWGHHGELGSTNPYAAEVPATPEESPAAEAVKKENPMHCCYIPDENQAAAIEAKTLDEVRPLQCQNQAIWDFAYGYGSGETSQSCADHVAALLGDAPLVSIRELSA